MSGQKEPPGGPGGVRIVQYLDSCGSRFPPNLGNGWLCFEAIFDLPSVELTEGSVYRVSQRVVYGRAQLDTVGRLAADPDERYLLWLFAGEFRDHQGFRQCRRVAVDANASAGTDDSGTIVGGHGSCGTRIVDAVDDQDGVGI